MPLMLLDLDNTLVDRDAAFRDAVAAFLREHGLTGSDLPWVMAVDAAGYTPRQAWVTGDSTQAETAGVLRARTAERLGVRVHVLGSPPVEEAASARSTEMLPHRWRRPRTAVGSPLVRRLRRPEDAAGG